MPSKRDVQKRRIQAERVAAVRQTSESRRDRRRRLIVGSVAGFLAVMMVASLGVGLLGSGGGSNPDPGDFANAVDLESAPRPAILVPPEPGDSLAAETPCPLEDGTSPRTTGFATPPPLCIDPTVDYTVTLTTDLGDVELTIDPDLDVDAANLFITSARYHAYDDNPFWFVYDVGIAIGAALTSDSINQDAPDLGVGIEATAPPSPDAYGAGTIAMLADLDGLISSRFALITDELGATTLAVEPDHPVIGSITGGLDVARAIVTRAGSPGDTAPLEDIRIRSVAVAAIGA